MSWFNDKPEARRLMEWFTLGALGLRIHGSRWPLLLFSQDANPGSMAPAGKRMLPKCSLSYPLPFRWFGLDAAKSGAGSFWKGMDRLGLRRGQPGYCVGEIDAPGQKSKIS